MYIEGVTVSVRKDAALAFGLRRALFRKVGNVVHRLR
jgi:hypothetical protein